MHSYPPQNLLYHFIYNYYPFHNLNPQLLLSGELMAAIIINNILAKEQPLSPLRNQPIKTITHLLSAHFSYKVGGDQYFYAAFGNFFLKLLSTTLNSLPSWSFDSLTQTIQKQLTNNPSALQQINLIEPTFKERLYQIAYIYQRTNSLPSVNSNQIQLQKLQLIQSYFPTSIIEQPLSKNKIKKNFKKYTIIPKSIISKNLNKSIIPKNLNSTTSKKMEEERRTQVDEFETILLIQQQSLFPIQHSNQNQHQSNQQNQHQSNQQNQHQSNQQNQHQSNQPFNQNKTSPSIHMFYNQGKHQLILAFDDLLPQKQ